MNNNNQVMNNGQGINNQPTMTQPTVNQPKQTLDNAPILSLGMDYDIDPPA